MEHKSADPAYGTSEIEHHQYGTYSSKTSSGHGHVRNDKISEDELTGGDATNINDDV